MHQPVVRHQSLRAVLIGLAVAGLPFVASAAGAPRLTLKSGSPQAARAWVAARADRYETKFDQALVVTTANVAKVRFRCITPGCEFPAQDQADNVNRADPNAYDVTTKKGEAAIKLIVWTVTPENVVVVAQPADRANPQVRFLLNER